MALSLVACGRGDTTPTAETIAASACDELAEAGTPIERRLLEQELMDQVEQLDNVELPAVVGAMADRCHDLTAELRGGNATGPSAGDARLVLDQCSSDGADGTVENEGDDTITVRVRVRFTDSDDALLDSSIDVVDDLRPGEVGEWSVRHFGDDHVARCDSRTDSVT